MSLDLIRSINQEYAGLIEQELGGEEIFTDPRFLSELHHQILLKCRDQSGILIPTSEGQLSSFQYRVLKAIESLTSFWESKKIISYTETLKESPYLNALSEGDAEDLSRLGMYFDTVVTVDRVSGMLEWFAGLQDNIVAFVIFLRQLYQYIPLLSAQTDPPLIAIIPEATLKVMSEETVDTPVDFFNHVEYRAEQNCLLALNNFSKRPIDLSTLKYFLAPGDRPGHVDISEWFDQDELKKFFIPKDKGANSHSDPVAQEFLDALRGNKSIVTTTTLASIVRSMKGLFYAMARQDALCSLSYSDPVIDDEYKFLLKSQIECDFSARTLKLDQDKFAATSITSPAFDWLSGLSCEDLLSFREIGGAQFLRDLFRKQRKRIKHARLEDFDRILQNVHEDLLKEFEIYEKGKEKTKKELKKKIGKISLSFGATITLGFISVAIPPLRYITVPTAAFSALVGSSSLKDLLNEYLEGKKQIEELSERPVGLLLNIWKKGKQNKELNP